MWVTVIGAVSEPSARKDDYQDNIIIVTDSIQNWESGDSLLWGQIQALINNNSTRILVENARIVLEVLVCVLR